MSDVPFGRLGFGAATLGNLYREITEDDANEVLAAAWDAGIRYFDTAPHYGLGLSERRLGAFLATKPRNQFVVSTKVGRLIRPNPDGIGGVDTAILFAGAQGTFPALDQVNVQVPPGLAGRGVVDIVLTVDGQAANIVTILVQ